MGITDVTVVRGFAKQAVSFPGIRTVDNDEHASTKELYSLHVARDWIKGNTVISYGDILFKDHVLHELINSDSDISIVVDADCDFDDNYMDLVQTDRPYSRTAFNTPVTLKRMSSDLPRETVSGEFIGLWKVNQKGAAAVKSALECMAKDENFKSLRMADLFSRLAGETTVSVIYTRGAWMDVDSIVDLTRASEVQ
jgi:phosphoenolpyruvate phosphomutase